MAASVTEKGIKGLINELPFYGFLMLTLERRNVKSESLSFLSSTPSNKIYLGINEEMVEEMNLTSSNMSAVVLHELMHLSYNHIFHPEWQKESILYNIATDLFINSIIKNDYKSFDLPKFFLLPEMFGFKEKESTAYYFEALQKMAQDIENKMSGNSSEGEGEGDGDSQDGGQEEQSQSNSSSNSELTQEEQTLKDLMDQAAKNKQNQQGQGQGNGSGEGQSEGNGQGNGNGNGQPWKHQTSDISKMSKEDLENLCDVVEQQLAQVGKEVEELHGGNGRGTIPGHIKQLMEKLFRIKIPVVSWKKLLKRFMASHMDVTRKTTRRKQSRRFSHNPGTRKDRKHKVLYAIDTSGSMSQSDLSDAFSEVHNVWKGGAIIDIVECDTQINTVYKYDGTPPKYITGRGGTAIAPAIKYFNKNIKEYSCLVIVTDGYHERPHIKSTKPVLHVVTQRQFKPEDFADLPYTTLIMND